LIGRGFISSDNPFATCPRIHATKESRSRSEPKLPIVSHSQSITLSAMGSEPLGIQERENQITQRAEGNERSQRIIKDHDSFSSPPFAGIGVGDRKCEQAERVRDHQNVHHGELPYALDCYYCLARSRGGGCVRSAAQQSLAPPAFFQTSRCHSTHRFSRWPRRQRYNDLIRSRPS
jgi:hypothetical protein